VDYPVHDLSPTSFPRVDVYPRKDLNGPGQLTAFAAMVDQGDGIVSLPPGKGKTVVALHAWCASKVPMMVVVHTQDLAWQWKDRIVEHTTLSEKDIGWVQGDKFDWEKPIVIAMIQTLASKAEDLPPELSRHLGAIVYDEVHHLGAPWFNRTASLCHGRRWGLSATVERTDGLDYLFRYHVGPVLYETTEHDVIPETFFRRTGVRASTEDANAMKDRAGDINTMALYRWLAENDARNGQIVKMIDEARSEGRKILVLSELVDHIELLRAQFKGAGLLHGEIKGSERQAILNGHDLVFATTKLAQEGLDRKDLDTLFVTLPFSSPLRMRQIWGRIQRKFEGKLPPVVVVFEDEHIKASHSMCDALRYHLTALKYPYSVSR
jgi:superfamily II DNA or RNA helicase